MKQVSPGDSLSEKVQHYEIHLEHQRNVLRQIIDVGASLRLGRDTDTLLKRVCFAACNALRFRIAALYLSDGKGYYRWSALVGGPAESEEYLSEHPLPEAVVEQLTSETYRLGSSYFIPAESPAWQSEIIKSFFVEDKSVEIFEPSPASPHTWRSQDLMIVPLVGGDNKMLGFLTPDGPLDGLRPTAETMSLFELFANQAAIAIEGARLYEEARQSSEERAAVIEIGRALSAPSALHDLHSVYRTIYEHVKSVMPADALLIRRYQASSDEMFTEYLVDEGVEYPATYLGPISPHTRLLLSQSFLFSTPQEYQDFVDYPSEEAEDNDLFGNGRPSQSFLFVPIRYGEETLGILSAQSYETHAYTERHREILSEIGVQAGIAITNARLNAELRKALKQAQESERLKNQFLMTASHELRTPLTAIQGYLELLGEFGHVLAEEDKARFLNQARRACDELVLLLGNVMDASRIDQDRVTLTCGSVGVAQAVQVVLEILEPIIAREERPVEINVASDLHVWADDLRLRQILLNLLGNALKYTPAPTKIAVSAECVSWEKLHECIPAAPAPQLPVPASGHFVVVAIRDWGPGVALKDQPHLFTKFMRLTGALNSMQRGAGLGLYLCRQLTEAMGGYIWMESTGVDGEGSSFYVALPQC